jgi:hypothetical protein
MSGCPACSTLSTQRMRHDPRHHPRPVAQRPCQSLARKKQHERESKMTRQGDWMQTYTGRQFWPMDPRPDEIDILDIAHSLSMMCRYAGHVTDFYSVAEHCCHVHDAAPPEHRAWALLHDASEAYLVDVPRPVKPFLPGYKAAEARVMAAVADRFGLPLQEPPEVKDLDARILHDESAQAMRRPPVPWHLPGGPVGVTLHFWSPMTAKLEFLGRCGALGIE